MKSLKISVFLAVISALILSAAQVSAQEQKPSQKSEMKTMGKMSMDEMMKDCKENHESAMKSVDQMMKMMDGAKQSNDPAKMGAAQDQRTKTTREMKEHMTMCRNMMGMMEKMQGMGGMMKGGSK